MAKKPKGKNRRRPVTYRDYLTDDGLIKLEGWARDGLTNVQIAHNIGIAEGTIYDWMKKYSKIDEALKKGKEVVDRQVENSLFNRAIGYGYQEKTRERIIKKDKYGEPMRDANGAYIYEMVTTKEVTKHLAGDTTAMIFWLKNRKPEQWRDKREIEHSGEIDAGASKALEERLESDERSRELLKELWGHNKTMEGISKD